MSILGHLEPKGVFKYFEEICSIPHGSGNTAAMTDYLMQFALDRGIWARRDEIGNYSGTYGYGCGKDSGLHKRYGNRRAGFGHR